MQASNCAGSIVKRQKKIVSIQSRVPLRCLQRPVIFFFFLSYVLIFPPVYG
jgi:hypothetical protein